MDAEGNVYQVDPYAPTAAPVTVDGKPVKGQTRTPADTTGKLNDVDARMLGDLQARTKRAREELADINKKLGKDWFWHSDSMLERKAELEKEIEDNERAQWEIGRRSDPNNPVLEQVGRSRGWIKDAGTANMDKSPSDGTEQPQELKELEGAINGQGVGPMMSGIASGDATAGGGDSAQQDRIEQNRAQVRDALSKWPGLSEEQFMAALRDVDGNVPDERHREVMRKLYREETAARAQGAPAQEQPSTPADAARGVFRGVQRDPKTNEKYISRTLYDMLVKKYGQELIDKVMTAQKIAKRG